MLYKAAWWWIPCDLEHVGAILNIFKHFIIILIVSTNCIFVHALDNECLTQLYVCKRPCSVDSHNMHCWEIFKWIYRLTFWAVRWRAQRAMLKSVLERGAWWLSLKPCVRSFKNCGHPIHPSVLLCNVSDCILSSVRNDHRQCCVSHHTSAYVIFKWGITQCWSHISDLEYNYSVPPVGFL